jgi:hypothetical protein
MTSEKLSDLSLAALCCLQHVSESASDAVPAEALDDLHTAAGSTAAAACAGRVLFAWQLQQKPMQLQML